MARPSIAFPVPPPHYDARWASELIRLLEWFSQQTIKQGQDVEPYPGRVILRSPNGTRWALKVNDVGQLSVEVVS